MKQRRNYRVVFAYDGSGFHGFAWLPDRPSVEGCIVAGLRTLVPELPKLSRAGRTDRGVHALGQVISFWCYREFTAEAIADAIETHGQGQIWVQHVEVVPRAFHATFSATSRHYIYLKEEATEVDVALLDGMLRRLEGERCFSAYARQTPKGGNTVKQLLQARARRSGTGGIRFDFVAAGFLRRQVRVMVATALREARADAEEGRLLQLCQRGERRETAPAADPDGLYLAEVHYPPEAFVFAGKGARGGLRRR